jgi:hypothetical protein
MCPTQRFLQIQAPSLQYAMFCGLKHNILFNYSIQMALLATGLWCGCIFEIRGLVPPGFLFFLATRPGAQRKDVTQEPCNAQY